MRHRNPTTTPATSEQEPEQAVARRRQTHHCQHHYTDEKTWSTKQPILKPEEGFGYDNQINGPLFSCVCVWGREGEAW